MRKAAAGLLLLLAAMGSAEAQGVPAPDRRWTPACPPSGTLAFASATQSKPTWRASREFYGSVPGSPLTCLIRDGAGVATPGGPMTSGIVQSPLQASLDACILHMLRRILPAAPNQDARYERVTREGGQLKALFRGRVTFDGFVRLELPATVLEAPRPRGATGAARLPGGTEAARPPGATGAARLPGATEAAPRPVAFEAARLRIEEEDVLSMGATETIYDFDVVSGVLLRLTRTVTRGEPPKEPSWEVTLLRPNPLPTATPADLSGPPGETPADCSPRP